VAFISGSVYLRGWGASQASPFDASCFSIYKEMLELLIQTNMLVANQEKKSFSKEGLPGYKVKFCISVEIHDH
jgi:hypothetical protein